jgi:hypothetical protein
MSISHASRSRQTRVRQYDTIGVPERSISRGVRSELQIRAAATTAGCSTIRPVAGLVAHLRLPLLAPLRSPANHYITPCSREPAQASAHDAIAILYELLMQINSRAG